MEDAEEKGKKMGRMMKEIKGLSCYTLLLSLRRPPPASYKKNRFFRRCLMPARTHWTSPRERERGEISFPLFLPAKDGKRASQNEGGKEKGNRDEGRKDRFLSPFLLRTSHLMHLPATR